MVPVSGKRGIGQNRTEHKYGISAYLKINQIVGNMMLRGLVMKVPETMVLIIYVIYDWGRSFALVETDKATITDPKWFPLNRKFLLNTELRPTMINKERSRDMRQLLMRFSPLMTLAAILKSLTIFQSTSSNIYPSPHSVQLNQIYRVV